MSRASLLLAVAPAMLLSACGDGPTMDPRQQTGPNPTLPAVRQYLFPPMGIARTQPWKQSEAPVAAAGLKVAAFAKGLSHPRTVTALPNGDVLVVESNGPGEPVTRPKTLIMGMIMGSAGAAAPSADRITLLRDADGDGVPETRTVFLEGLHSPFGVALIGNYLYVANTDALMRYAYTAGETRITAKGERLTELPGGPIDHHWTKSLLASADGTKLYVGVGSNSNAGENGMEAERERAAIWEVDVATGAHRIYASGIRNPTALSWEPVSGKLWAVANERDELGPDLVPDYLTSVREKGFYGWPYSYWGQHVDPRVMPQRPDLVAKAIPPDYSLSSHVAPLGMIFYTGNGLPAAYRGGAFVSEHGSWNRHPLNGYKLVFVPFAGGRPNGAPQDVLTGFLTPENRAHGRPVGLAIDKSGALLVADDLGNTVWRVTAAR